MPRLLMGSITLFSHMGYAPSINDYKLFKAINAPLVVMFSLKTSAWKLVEGFHYEKLTEV